MVSYRVMPGVPRDLIWFVSGLLAARRREIGTRRGTRRLGCYKQALFALAWFRDKGDIPRLGAGFGLSAVHRVPVPGRGHRGAGGPRAGPAGAAGARPGRRARRT